MKDELRAQVGYLTACGIAQKEISERLGLTAQRVSFIQCALKLNPRRGLKRTRRQREKIVERMTRARAPQSEIAKRTGMSRVGVYKCQQRLGLRQFTNRDLSLKKKRQIIALLRVGIPERRIQLALGVGRRIVLKFREKIKSNG